MKRSTTFLFCMSWAWLGLGHARTTEPPKEKTEAPARMPSPVFRRLEDLKKGVLPEGPLLLHIGKAEGDRQLAGVTRVKGQPPKGASGLYLLRDPFGDILGLEACVAQSSEGTACLPSHRGTVQGVSIGGSCRCFQEGRTFELQPASECRLVQQFGADKCDGSCTGTKKCEKVLYDPGPCPSNLPPGVYCLAPFLTCECR